MPVGAGCDVGCEVGCEVIFRSQRVSGPFSTPRFCLPLPDFCSLHILPLTFFRDIPMTSCDSLPQRCNLLLHCLLLSVFLLAFPAVLTADESAAEKSQQLEFFESRIRPVLVQHCYECHSAQSSPIQAGLVVDTAAGLLRGGDSGPAITAGDGKSSLLLQALRHESFEMPPKGKLPDQVIQDFEKWIVAGAVDPRDGAAASVSGEINFDSARKFWSFQAPVRPERPQVSNIAWPKGEIDYHIMAQLDVRGLRPVAAAGREQLLRRATFDLIGLPPTPAEIDSFVADKSPQAFAKVLDRLLASPHYGERWGRYWLDVARYSEDQAHTFSVTPNTSGYRYRDWVIQAFNQDLPFDQFVRLQIAGDLMDFAETQRLAQLPALGFFGLGAQYYKNTDAARARADELDDRVDTLTRGFLGLTVSCARCHDHKFDPIPQQDYYSLAGIFHSSQLQTVPLVPQEDVQLWNQAQERVKELEKKISETIAASGPRIREAELQRVADYLTAAFRVEQTARSSQPKNADQVAAAGGLDRDFLSRWVKFLKEDSSGLRLVQVLQDELAALPASVAADAAVPADVTNAATGFQRYLQLLLKQRDGELTDAELQELRGIDQPGNAVYTSRIVNHSAPAVEIDVDLTGAKKLFLVVTDAGDGNSCDHTDWVNPTLVTADGEISLLDLQWTTAKATYGNINRNQNVQGQPIRIGGKSYENGLGTHASSLIAYDLPDGVTRFRGIAGLDNSGTDQGGCGQNATVQFRLYTSMPSDFSVGSEDLLTRISGEKGIFAVDPKKLEELLPEAGRQELAEQRAELEQLRQDVPERYPEAHVISEARAEDMNVFLRGNPANQGERAPRRFLKILAGDEPPLYQGGSGRLQLADAIASADNPLTARVIANRIWQHHFGRGLVATPDNFGSLGEAPSHPQLLDYLALRLIEEGWSMKALHREIMLSAVYQLDSSSNSSNEQSDADNRWLWRMPRQRLDIEAWRDSLLAVSGRLDPAQQGPSTRLTDADNSRRTVYAFISRHELDNMLRLFDFPDPNITSSTRSETTVPQQQLFVINSPFMLRQAEAFAQRLQQEAPDSDAQRIRLAFRLAYGREVTEPELQLGQAFLQQSDTEAQREGTQLSRLARYTQVLLASNEFMYID